jgi:hypothetical protein
MIKKYMLTFDFTMDDDFTSFIAPHQTLVNRLIDTHVIDHYAISMEAKKGWIIFKTDTKEQIEGYMSQSPLYDYLNNFDISELFMLDGPHLRLPTNVELN